MAKKYVQTSGGLKNLSHTSLMTPPLTDGVNSATSVRTAITCTGSASPNNFDTPGAWVEIDPSLSADSSGVMVVLTVATWLSIGNSSTLIQIGVGAAASETVHATLSVGYAVLSYAVYVPGLIEAGTRVSVRVLSAAQTDKAITARYIFMSGNNISAPTSYGFDATNARGAALSWGGLNTKGSYGEITASTTDDIDVISVFMQAGGDTAMNAAAVLLDIATGAASSEVVLIPDLFYETFTSESMRMSGMVYSFVLDETIPAGTRIAARYQTSGGSNTVMDVGIITAKRN
jgi:hypothetical protein